MTVHVQFDDRERVLSEAFRAYLDEHRKDAQFTVTVERLPMADVLVRGERLTVAIERKEVLDLMSNAALRMRMHMHAERWRRVFDGRLTEQTQRLSDWREAAPDRWSLLLVEGDARPARFRAGLSRWRFFVKLNLLRALEAAPAERRLYLRTADARESAAAIATLYKTIVPTLGDGGQTAAATGAATALPAKRRGDAFLGQLCCTRGMSMRRAQGIRERFPNLCALINAASDASRAADAYAIVSGAAGGHRVGARLWADLGLGDPPVDASRPGRRRRR